METKQKAARGQAACTWGVIYAAHKEGRVPPSMEPEVMVKWLIHHGRLPSAAVSNAGCPLADLRGEDQGRRIHLEIDLCRGQGIAQALAVIGEVLEQYAVQDAGDLQRALEDAKLAMFGVANAPRVKTSHGVSEDVARAVGLFLKARVDDGRTVQQALEGLQALAKREDEAAYAAFKLQRGREKDSSRATFDRNNKALSVISNLDYGKAHRWHRVAVESVSQGAATPLK